MEGDRTPVVLAMGEGEALWCVGALTTVKAEGQQTGGAYALIEHSLHYRSILFRRTTKRNESSTAALW